MSKDRINKAWGSKDIDTLFPDGAAMTVPPWPRAGSRKDRTDFDTHVVDNAVRERKLVSVDPRNLHSTQGGLTRAGVSHYLQSDENYKEGWKAGNKDPVVYDRNGTQMLLSGHHRAATALLRGEQFDAVLAKGDWGAPR